VKAESREQRRCGPSSCHIWNVIHHGPIEGGRMAQEAYSEEGAW
jgi:hypothetical protein